MSRNNKIFLGIITLLPVLGTLAFMIYLFSMVFDIIIEIPEGTEPDLEMIFGNIFILVGLGVTLGLFSIGVTIYYIIRASNNYALEQNLRIIWIIALLLTSGFGSIVYWYLYIWKPDEKSTVRTN